MKFWKSNNLLLMALVLAFVLLASGVSSRAQTPTSASPSKTSAIRADLVNACAAAVGDLKATRLLAEALERENQLLKERLATEKRATAILTELAETRKAESDALRATVAAKNETIAAKDTVIAKQDSLIATLKKKKISPWKRIADVLVGVGIAVILK